MDFKDFKLPPSLKGKVFRAEEFFKEKATSPHSNFLLKHLSNASRIIMDDGTFIHRRIAIPLDTGRSPEGYVFPGGCNLSDLDFSHLAHLAGEMEWQPSDCSGLLFVDLETTGLAGGTGTFPFLCGVGYFEGRSFVVEQLFMEDYPYEVFMLRHLAEKLKGAISLVTFNGKTFDIPLLATRFIYNRLRVNLKLPHIDLLHPARRIWKGTLTDCRLESIEREYFGLQRERDVESSLIPMIYFNFVRGRNKESMLPVFDHNVQDIATLGALLLIFSRMLANPEGELLHKPLELWGLGGLCLKMGWMEKSLLCMQRALTLADDPDLTPLLLIHTARLYRKLGRMKDALRTWEHLMATSPRHRLTGAIELAKYYEHQARNPNRAREVILKALKGVEISSELESYISGVPSGSGAELTPELEKRLRRLERKIGLLH